MPRITCICWVIFFSYGFNLIYTCSREPRNMTVKLIYNMPRHWYRSYVASTSVINDKRSDVKGSRVKINTGYIGEGECVPENAAWQIRRLPAFVRRSFLVPSVSLQTTLSSMYVLFVQDRLRKSKSIIFYASYLSLGRVYPFSIRKKYEHVSIISVCFTHIIKPRVCHRVCNLRVA